MASAPENTRQEEPFDLCLLCIDEVVYVKLRGNRELVGKLHGWDTHCNMVLGDVTETIYIVDDEDESEVVETITKRADMLFVRGDSVVMIAPQPES